MIRVNASLDAGADAHGFRIVARDILTVNGVQIDQVSAVGPHTRRYEGGLPLNQPTVPSNVILGLPQLVDLVSLSELALPFLWRVDREKTGFRNVGDDIELNVGAAPGVTADSLNVRQWNLSAISRGGFSYQISNGGMLPETLVIPAAALDGFQVDTLSIRVGVHQLFTLALDTGGQYVASLAIGTQLEWQVITR